MVDANSKALCVFIRVMTFDTRGCGYLIAFHNLAAYFPQLTYGATTAC